MMLSLIFLHFFQRNQDGCFRLACELTYVPSSLTTTDAEEN